MPVVDANDLEVLTFIDFHLVADPLAEVAGECFSQHHHATIAGLQQAARIHRLFTGADRRRSDTLHDDAIEAFVNERNRVEQDRLNRGDARELP